MSDSADSVLDRRRFLQLAALAGAAGATANLMGKRPAVAQTPGGDFEWEEATIAQMQEAMESGEVTSAELTQTYIDRIAEVDHDGPRLNAVMEVNPEALAIARQLDDERASSGPRSPLHGIPILFKDNIDSDDQMETTAGSLALVGVPVERDAFLIERLRSAGAVLLGKTNLSEWANFRSLHSSSGWSARAGQCLNPYVLDHNPCGSSSGSGAAIAANLAAAALGTETDGSIVCPSSACGIVGIKPTLGLTSRSGVIPIAHSQDVVGPMARTVADAATVLGPLTGVDPRDPETRRSRNRALDDYRGALDAGALNGARIGVWREGGFGASEETDAVIEDALAALRDAGATVVDPVKIPGSGGLGDPEFTVLLFEFKADLNAYLQTRPGGPRSLQELIEFNRANADAELTYFGQEIFELAQAKRSLQSRAYKEALRRARRVSRGGINHALRQKNLDALVAPTGSPSWPTDLINGDHFLLGSSTPAAVAGFPNITVPAGFSNELPVGMSFFGTAWSEPTLISLAYAFEQATEVRRPPQFLPTVGTADFRER